MIYILLATFFIFTAFISLLFGLNAFLESTESKISAFFIIAIIFLLLALTMAFFVVKFFKKQAFFGIINLLKNKILCTYKFSKTLVEINKIW